ncbi:MAG: DNA recombination protein RmuC [Candidatus Bathyarchaeia archaeon]
MGLAVRNSENNLLLLATHRLVFQLNLDLFALPLLVSPATLAINLNLIAVGLQAMEISEKAEQIQKNLGKLSASLKDVEKEWNILYDHIQKAYNKAIDVDKKQTHLKDLFKQITQIEEQSEKG